jgi:hypothetical protein
MACARLDGDRDRVGLLHRRRRGADHSRHQRVQLFGCRRDNGNGNLTAGQTGCAAPGPATGQALGVSRTAYGHAGGTGDNTPTWDPQITIAIPLNSMAGTYTGTITHTVS